MTFNAENGKDYPFALRHDLTGQLKKLTKKFPDYNSFQDASIQDIFDKNELEKSLILQATTLETTLLINEGNFNPDKTVNHTHKGSVGNLCLDEIVAKKNSA